MIQGQHIYCIYDHDPDMATSYSIYTISRAIELPEAVTPGSVLLYSTLSLYRLLLHDAVLARDSMYKNE